MSEDKPHGATTIHPRKDHGDGGGGGAGKWILGAVAAAILVGGGYYAWTNYGQSSNTTELAQNDDPYAYEPLPADSNDIDQSATAEDVAIDEPAAAPASADTPRAAPARRSAARAEPVPEATIGVTPASATSDESAVSAEYASAEDEVVITARRPIWTSTPSPRRLSAMYPQRALDRGREGEARLACVVQERGRLSCDQIEATPGGFGAAAERVAGAYRHSTTLANGESAIGSPVNVRVIFRINEDDRGRRFASR